MPSFDNFKTLLKWGGIIFLIFLILFAYLQGKKSEEIKQITQTQAEQINIQNEIISTTQKVFKRKIINRSIPVNDDLLWLQQHICQDCNP